MSVPELTGPLLRLHPEDPVAVARHDLAPGEPLTGDERPLLTREPIPSGHKVALRTIEEGQPVHKYGQVIGAATRRILAGEHVHDHNLLSPSRRLALPSTAGSGAADSGAVGSGAVGSGAADSGAADSGAIASTGSPAAHPVLAPARPAAPTSPT